MVPGLVLVKKNKMVSCGEKLTGGRVLAPVTKARIVPSFCVPT